MFTSNFFTSSIWKWGIHPCTLYRLYIFLKQTPTSDAEYKDKQAFVGWNGLSRLYKSE